MLRLNVYIIEPRVHSFLALDFYPLHKVVEILVSEDRVDDLETSAPCTYALHQKCFMYSSCIACLEIRVRMYSNVSAHPVVFKWSAACMPS